MLRDLALKKRDESIAKAKEQYTETLAQIAAIEQKLVVAPVVARPKTKRSHLLIDLVCDSLPKTRPFTITDVVAEMKAADPERQFSVASVRTNIHRLMKQDVVVRVRHAVSHGCAIYAVSTLELGERPFGDATQVQVAELVLRELGKPTNSLDLLTAMEQRGYKAESDAKTVRTSLERNLSKKPHLFRQENERWRLLDAE